LSSAALTIDTDGSHAAVAVRLAGIILALGYLSGLVGGTLLTLAGAFALITGGRLLVSDRRDSIFVGVGFAVISLALGAVALRWGTTSLHEWREIQSVLGSPIALEPQVGAIGCGLAAFGGTLASVLWLTGERPVGRPAKLLQIVEVSTIAVALVTAFWGAGVPDSGGSDIALGVARWIVLTALGAALTIFASRKLKRSSSRLLIVGAAVAVVSTVVSLSLLASEL
jgi:hypothetical protein